jgi:type II secretory pathway pseudopilin PulG
MISIGIIGLLVAVLLPAVQAARAAARQLSCGNNLRQIGLALHNYESTHSCFPASFFTTRFQNAQGTGASWSIHGRLLPFLEQGSAAERVKLDVDWHQQVSTGVTAMHLPVFLCPSEPNNQYRTKDGKPYVAPHTYGFNLGTWMVYDPSTGTSGDGAFVVNRGSRTTDIRDGLSNTLAVAEVKAYQSYVRNTNDPGAVGPTSPAEFAAVSGQLKQTGHTVWPDGRVHHSGVTTVFTPNTRVSYLSNGIEYDIDFNSQQEGKSATRITYAAVTSRSYHHGMVNILLMDGSVRALSDRIDQKLWTALGTRHGGEVVGHF